MGYRALARAQNPVVSAEFFLPEMTFFPIAP